jgi:CRP-like cAMP-binding protein
VDLIERAITILDELDGDPGLSPLDLVVEWQGPISPVLAWMGGRHGRRRTVVLQPHIMSGSAMAELGLASKHPNRLLAAMEPEDLARLQPHLEVMKDLPSGAVLYESGEAIRYAYFPHDCMISLVAVMKDGGMVEMTVFGREAVFGLVSALISREALGRYVVQIPGSASRIPVEHLQAVIRKSPALQELFWRYTGALLAQTFQTVACNAVHTVEARCARWILSTHDRVDHDTLPLTHEFLAEMLGVQRSTVSLVTRTLQTAGLITQSRGVITVADRDGLEEITCECYGIIRRSFERLLPNTYARR